MLLLKRPRSPHITCSTDASKPLYIRGDRLVLGKVTILQFHNHHIVFLKMITPHLDLNTHILLLNCINKRRNILPPATRQECVKERGSGGKEMRSNMLKFLR